MSAIVKIRQAVAGLLVVSGSMFWGVVSFSGEAEASPWVATDDERMRHSLQLLADFQIIDTSLTTWPVMWGNVEAQLQKVVPESLPPSLVSAYHYVQSRLITYQAKQLRQSVQIGAANSENPFRSFGADFREESGLNYSVNTDEGNLSAGLSINYRYDSSDDKEWVLDGSYVAYSLGNWSLSVGAIERWWGPGWSNSLILSNNARPVPAVALRRIVAEPFESSWLSWIGAWDFSAFIGQLESNRRIPEAKLVGMRLTLRPLDGLEIGLTRTAQWAGDGRPSGFSSFVDLMLGIDNRGDNGITLSNEPGNQLGALDMRYGFIVGDNVTAALYTQFAGEDESGGLPSRYTGLVGAEVGLANVYSLGDLRLFVEYLDTATESITGEPRYNYAYEHAIYGSGYRYYGRSLGANIDGDGRALVLGIALFLPDDQQWQMQIAAYDLNRDDITFGNHMFPAKEQLHQLTVSYERPIGFGSIAVGGHVASNEVESRLTNISRYAVNAAWKYEF